MSNFALQKNQAVVVARTGSSEQLVKIQLIDVDAGQATLDFAAGDRVTVYTADAWDEMQADRRAGKLRTASDRPPQRAPYMN
jgi:hypothetical protein